MTEPSAHDELLVEQGVAFDETAPLLEISGLRTDIVLKRSTVHAVDCVDLRVEAGE